jgi:hypothetical protein
MSGNNSRSKVQKRRWTDSTRIKAAFEEKRKNSGMSEAELEREQRKLLGLQVDGCS